MEIITERLKNLLEEAEKEKEQLETRLKNKPSFGPGEGATMVTSWEMALARKESVLARIEALQEALARIENGTYGYCENCGKQIDPERLEILPDAQRCAECAH